MIDRIEMWCLLYRNDLMVRGSDTNNYTEVMFRLLKDIPLERTKAFNLTQLADFISTSFESYFTQRIMDLIFNRVSKAVAKKYFPDERENDVYNIISLGNMDFRVNSSRDPDTFYDVDMSVFKCSCPVGYNGHHCKHQGAVAKKYNIFTATNTLSLSSKHILYEIALGKIANSSTFDTLKIDGAIATNSNQNIYSSNISSAQSQRNQQTFLYDDVNNDAMELDENPNIDIETIKEKWTAHSNLIMSRLENDPESFGPAIIKYLDNCNKYAKSNQSLISGLHCAFKYTGISFKNKK